MTVTTTDQHIHVPVLLQKIIEVLDIKADGTYIDCTLGDGGHSSEIYRRLSSGNLVSIDCDAMAIEHVRKEYAQELTTGRWKLVHDNFSNLGDIASRLNLQRIDGVLFDLGLSSRQLDADDQKRGFSYLRDEPLDMRMDTRLNVRAMDLLRALSAKELEKLFRNYGEEPFARAISRKIKQSMIDDPQAITADRIAALVRKVVPAGYRKGSKHPARRVFQALRIAVNDELQNLQRGLSSALSVVSPGGVLVVLAYHSLEDRIVKGYFADAVGQGIVESMTKNVLTPDARECEDNPRSASAKLRAVKKFESK